MPGVLLNRSNSSVTEKYHPSFLIEEAEGWLEEPWCDKNRPVYHAVQTLLTKAKGTLEHRRSHHDNYLVYVNMFYRFDSEGYRIPFCRLEFLGALSRWHLEVSGMCEEEPDEQEAREVRECVRTINRAMIVAERDEGRPNVPPNVAVEFLEDEEEEREDDEEAETEREDEGQEEEEESEEE